MRLDVMRPDPDRVGAIRNRLPAGRRHPIPARRAMTIRSPVLDDLRGVDRRIGEHPRRQQALRPAIDVRGRPVLHDAAFVHQRGMAAEQQGLDRLGGGIDHRAVAAGEQLRQLVAQLLAQLVVEIGERLVEQHEIGVLDERPGDRGALLLAAGQLVRHAPQHRRDAHQLGDPGDPVVELALRHPGDPQGRGDVLVDREVRVVDELLIDHRDVALLHRHVGHFRALEPDLARGRLVDAGHQLHQGGLARQRRAQQDVEALLREHEIGLVDVGLGADPLGELSQFESHGPPMGSTFIDRQASWREWGRTRTERVLPGLTKWSERSGSAAQLFCHRWTSSS